MKVKTFSYDLGYPLQGAAYVENDVLLVVGGSAPGPSSKLTALKINFDKKRVIRRYRELALDAFDDTPTSLDAARGLILMGCNEIEQRVMETGANHHLRKYTFKDEHLKPVANIDLDHVSGDLSSIYYTKLISIAPNASVAAIASSRLPTVIKIIDPIEFSINYEIETTSDVLTMQFSPDSSTLAYVTAGSLDVVSIVSGKFILRKTDFDPKLNLVSCNFIDDTTLLVVAMSSTTSELVLIKVKFSSKQGAKPVISRVQIPAKTFSNIVSVELAPNRTFAALATDAETILLIDPETLTVINTELKTEHMGPIKKVLVSPDSRCIASISSGKMAVQVIQLPTKLKSGPGFWSSLGSFIKLLFKIIFNFALVVLLAYGAQMAYERNLHIKAYDYCHDLYFTRYKVTLYRYLEKLYSYAGVNDDIHEDNYFKINDHSYEIVSSTTIVQGDIVSVTSFTRLLEATSTLSTSVLERGTSIENEWSSIVMHVPSSKPKPRIVELHPPMTSIIERGPTFDIESSKPVYISSISSSMFVDTFISANLNFADSSSTTNIIERKSIFDIDSSTPVYVSPSFAITFSEPISTTLSSTSTSVLIDTTLLPIPEQSTSTEVLQSSRSVSLSIPSHHHVSITSDTSVNTGILPQQQTPSVSIVRRQITLDNVVYEVVATLTNLGASELETVSEQLSSTPSLQPTAIESSLNAIHETFLSSHPDTSSSSSNTQQLISSISGVSFTLKSEPVLAFQGDVPTTLSSSSLASVHQSTMSFLTAAPDANLEAHTELISTSLMNGILSREDTDDINALSSTLVGTETSPVLPAETTSPILSVHSLSSSQHTSLLNHGTSPTSPLEHSSVSTTFLGGSAKTPSEVDDSSSVIYQATETMKSEEPNQPSDILASHGLTTERVDHHNDVQSFVSHEPDSMENFMPSDMTSVPLSHSQNPEIVPSVSHVSYESMISNLAPIIDSHAENSVTHSSVEQDRSVSFTEITESPLEMLEATDTSSPFLKNHSHTEHEQLSEVAPHSSIVVDDTPVHPTVGMVHPAEHSSDNGYSQTSVLATVIHTASQPSHEVIMDVEQQSQKLDANGHGTLLQDINVQPVH